MLLTGEILEIVLAVFSVKAISENMCVTDCDSQCFSQVRELNIASDMMLESFLWNVEECSLLMLEARQKFDIEL